MLLFALSSFLLSIYFFQKAALDKDRLFDSGPHNSEGEAIKLIYATRMHLETSYDVMLVERVTGNYLSH